MSDTDKKKPRDIYSPPVETNLNLCENDSGSIYVELKWKAKSIASSTIAVTRNTGMAFVIAVAGAIVYNLAPFSTRGHAGPFADLQLNTFINGLHWAYIAGALLSLLSAFAALFAKDKTPS